MAKKRRDKRQTPIVMVDEKTRETIRFESVKVAAQHISDSQIKNGGVALNGKTAIPRIVNARREGRRAYGARWYRPGREPGSAPYVHPVAKRVTHKLLEDAKMVSDSMRADLAKETHIVHESEPGIFEVL